MLHKTWSQWYLTKEISRQSLVIQRKKLTKLFEMRNSIGCIKSNISISRYLYKSRLMGWNNTFQSLEPPTWPALSVTRLWKSWTTSMLRHASSEPSGCKICSALKYYTSHFMLLFLDIWNVFAKIVKQLITQPCGAHSLVRNIISWLKTV